MNTGKMRAAVSSTLHECVVTPGGFLNRVRKSALAGALRNDVRDTALGGPLQGKPGFCRHSDASRAFAPDDPHSDPGPAFPRDVYLEYVDAYYAEIRSAREGASAQ
jgi:hypothetical protein